jgi:hypothetical protein
MRYMFAAESSRVPSRRCGGEFLHSRHEGASGDGRGRARASLDRAVGCAVGARLFNAAGDQRLALTGRDRAPEQARAQDREADRSPSFRLLRVADGVVELASRTVIRVAEQVAASR